MIFKRCVNRWRLYIYEGKEREKKKKKEKKRNNTNKFGGTNLEAFMSAACPVLLLSGNLQAASSIRIPTPAPPSSSSSSSSSMVVVAGGKGDSNVEESSLLTVTVVGGPSVAAAASLTMLSLAVERLGSGTHWFRDRDAFF